MPGTRVRKARFVHADHDKAGGQAKGPQRFGRNVRRCHRRGIPSKLPRKMETGGVAYLTLHIGAVSYMRIRGVSHFPYQETSRALIRQALTHTDEDTSQVQGNSAWLDRHGAKAGVFEDLVLR